MNSNDTRFIGPIRHEEHETNPLKLAILPVSLKGLEDALYLPEGYAFVSASYDERSRMLKILVSSEELPEVDEDRPLPEIDMIFQVEHMPNDPQTRRITARITHP